MGTGTSGTTLGARILVLENAEGGVYRTLTGAAAAADAHVDLELSAAGVIDRMRLRTYDLVVIAAPMTALAGILLLQDIRADRGRDAAVMVVAEPDQSVMLLDAMVDDCCIRPIADEELVERIMHLAVQPAAARN